MFDRKSVYRLEVVLTDLDTSYVVPMPRLSSSGLFDGYVSLEAFFPLPGLSSHRDIGSISLDFGKIDGNTLPPIDSLTRLDLDSFTSGERLQNIITFGNREKEVVQLFNGMRPRTDYEIVIAKTNLGRSWIQNSPYLLKMVFNYYYSEGIRP